MKKALHLIIALLAFVGVANAQIVYDFEDGTIPSAFDNDATYPWTVESVISSTGNYCIQSGNGGHHSTSSTISLTQSFAEAGYIKFDASCRGEGHKGNSTIWDRCEFIIDGEVLFTYGDGNPGWFTHGYNVAAGTHVFEWSYTKDGSTHPEGDYFQVDNIVFGLGTACVAPSVVKAQTVANTAYVEWNGVSESFTLRYKKGSGSWTTISGIEENSYVIENLSTGDYTVEVQSDCVTGTWASGTFNAYAPATNADWYGFAASSYDPDLEYKFINVKMKDITSLTAASEVFPSEIVSPVFAKGNVWFRMYNSDASEYALYKAPIDIYTKTIGAPELVTSPFTSSNMAYNPVNGLIYYQDYNDDHFKSFNPEAIGPVTDYGALPSNYSNATFAINKDGEAYVIVYNSDNGLYELYTLNFNTLAMTLVGEMEYYVQNLAFDLQSDELFGFYYDEMYRIDPSTAQTNYLGLLGGESPVYVYGMFMVYDWDAVSEGNVENLTVYPNPSQGRFTVEGTGLMVVSNLLGQEILSQQIDGKATVELPKGVYLVRVNNAMSKVVVE